MMTAAPSSTIWGSGRLFCTDISMLVGNKLEIGETGVDAGGP